MKECWINIYAGYQYGFPYGIKDNAEDAAFHVHIRRIYRIHVRMK